MALSLVQAQAVALNRFGLGARPDEAPPANPKAWLLDQFGRFVTRPAAYAALPAPGVLARDHLARSYRPHAGDNGRPPASDLAAILQPKRNDQGEALGFESRSSYFPGVAARTISALETRAPFVERLANFWSNHFALSIEKPQVAIYAAAYEAEVIRPHVLGRFEDMLLAVEQHPAMLHYLDQYMSVGPGSEGSRRIVKNYPGVNIGLNENLAREIMELHTLGARSGYKQSDVTEFARALTGWSIGSLGYFAESEEPRNGAFLFRDMIHTPGDRTIMGKRYPAGGKEQALAAMRDFAAAPATARHISTKLARHFVADDPPAALVARMAKAFLDNRGALPPVYRVMVESPEAWMMPTAKFKTPWDWMVSALRGVRAPPDMFRANFASMLDRLGQPVWRPGSPAGYDDFSANWAAPGALITRVEYARIFATAAGAALDARALAPKLLPGLLRSGTAAAIAEAEDGAAALALLLVSPEFQRR